MKLDQTKHGRRLSGKVARNHSERQAQLQELLRAEKEAQEMGVKGRLRFDYLKHCAGLCELTEDRQVRRMLYEAKRIFARTGREL